jgi:ketosteroid isomerase-like protein
MRRLKTAVLSAWTKLVFASLIPLLPSMAGGVQSQQPCDLEPLMHQQRDEASIQRLEASWIAAISQGDIGFERCLLTEDFVEILSTGELKTRGGELDLTARNKGKKARVRELPQMTISIHGNVAVARAVWKPTGTALMAAHIADCFVWEDGAWHVFFSQLTPVDQSSRLLRSWLVI